MLACFLKRYFCIPSLVSVARKRNLRATPLSDFRRQQLPNRLALSEGMNHLKDLLVWKEIVENLHLPFNKPADEIAPLEDFQQVSHGHLHGALQSASSACILPRDTLAGGCSFKELGMFSLPEAAYMWHNGLLGCCLKKARSGRDSIKWHLVHFIEIRLDILSFFTSFQRMGL